MICGNNNAQIVGSFTGTAKVCGTITGIGYDDSVTETIYPGTEVTVTGFNMFGASDSIQIADHTLINTTSNTFNYITPLKQTASSGPIVILSKLGRRSESYGIYDFGVDTNACSVTLMTETVAPLTAKVGQSGYVSFMFVSCGQAPAILCLFGAAVEESATNQSIGICKVPVSAVSEAVTFSIEYAAVSGSQTLFTSEFQYGCPAFIVPANYTKLACDSNLRGAVCDLYCSEGYDGTALDPICDSDDNWPPTGGCTGM